MNQGLTANTGLSAGAAQAKRFPAGGIDED